jgi:hypothetical protein
MTDWNKRNIPEYQSDRVTVDVNYGDAEGRHSCPSQTIKIDGVPVNSVSWYEDDDFSSCSEERPNAVSQWNAFVSKLPD